MKTVTSSFFNDQTVFFTTKLLRWTICSLVPIALFLIYFYRLPILPFSSPISDFTHSNITDHSPPSPSPSSSYAEEKKAYQNQCDYSKGDWIKDTSSPLYNDSTCGMIKEGRNCIKHGRPDFDYLYWRWKPSECYLPRFEPITFLQLIRNKHIAFVGDSMARNQLESLLCMLSSVSVPNLVYQYGDDNKFSKWYFSSYNVSVSLYWSPFLVQGTEKSSTRPNNELYLDHVDEKWAKDMNQMDMIVLLVGHWFLLPAVYHEGDSVLGCHYCPGLNYTDMGFYDALRKALRTTLDSIIDRRENDKSKGFDVLVTTFTPHHFEGDWDKAGACPKTKPYRKGEKDVEGMNGEMRKVEIEEVVAAKVKGSENGRRFRFEVLDVTELAFLRPDGHPGPYMNPFPFLDGAHQHVQNDCVHWCLPGPIDTWNEIFLEIIKKWGEEIKMPFSFFS